MNNFEKTNTEEYLDNDCQKNISNEKDTLFDKLSFKNYTGDEFCELDLDYKHLEKAFTNKKHYMAMELLSLQEKKVLYYSIVKDYTLNGVSEQMNISKSEVVKLKKMAISNFKKNLKKICKGVN